MTENIIQLTKSPVPSDEYIVEEDFFDDFLGGLADYFRNTDETERKEIVQDWLEGFSTGGYRDYVVLGEDTIIFKKGFQELYARRRLDTLKVAVSTATVEDIISGSLRGKINALIGDPIGTYLYTDMGFFKEAVFLASYVEEEVPYYIGGVVKYHY